MKYIYQQEEKKIEINIDDLDSKYSSEEVKDINKNLLSILNNNSSLDMGIDSDIIRKIMRNKTSIIRDDILNKLLLSDNLNFLLSNGCSLYAGSEAINEESSNYQDVLKNFDVSGYQDLNRKINKLSSERPEIILDKLYQFLSYAKNILEDSKLIDEIDELIKQFKEIFINSSVLKVDYSKNHLHKLLLKRLMNREDDLNKINIFTLNYDLLIEKSAEELGINVNNGFIGFHDRKFDPSVYHTDLHFNYSNGKKAYGKGINLFKLHGSISWEFNDEKPPYGIIERQHNLKDISFDEIPECIIYPVQSKKRHSLDIPYSELFRQFIEFVNKPNSTLIIIGYSFLDEHVNDIISNFLANSDFNLIIFSYSNIDSKNNSDFFNTLVDRSKEDPRITIFFGNILGNFKYIVKYLMPYPNKDNNEQIFLNTLKQLKEGNYNEK
jgi:hypothetical protein